MLKSILIISISVLGAIAAPTPTSLKAPNDMQVEKRQCQIKDGVQTCAPCKLPPPDFTGIWVCKRAAEEVEEPRSLIHEKRACRIIDGVQICSPCPPPEDPNAIWVC
jgi:hypothetical protein